MSRRHTHPGTLRVPLLLTLLLAGASCTPMKPGPPPRVLHYVGSSTVAVFLRKAETAYRSTAFQMDTAPESAGGELAMLEGRADLAGVARQPGQEVLRAGIVATLIGHDAIAVIVHADNPVSGLTRDQLADLFGGAIVNWSEVGGPDLPVRPFIVGPDSATRSVFHDAVMSERDYTGCETVQPDRALISRVAAQPGGIGQISFSLLDQGSGVKTIAVDGHAPSVTNADYPIARPLFLLWRESDPEAETFVQWTQGDAGQRTVMQDFVAIRVIEAEAEDEIAAVGTLVVHTSTYPVHDGGIYYYPHHPYDILTRYGDLVRRVTNHRSENDETPTRVHLAPGIYLIRPRGTPGNPEFFVRVEAGQTTVVDVEEELRRR